MPPLLPMALTDTNKPAVPADANAGVTEKPSIVELKNGKVIFKQKPISFEKHSETLQEIVRFRELLEERISDNADPLSSFPEEHKPVIAKLAHESDKTLSALSKHILQELLPAQDEDNDEQTPLPLTLPVVENAIKSVVNRNNYGLDGLPGVKPPAAVCVWRWEANAHLDWLPKSARDKAETRMAERSKAKSDLKALFDLLPKDEQDAIVDPKGTAKVTTTDSQAIDLTNDDAKSAAGPSKKTKANEENNSTPAPKVGRPKKVLDSEKAAKEKEKQEKKAAKAEREQKAKEGQEKSRSLLQSFLKPGASARALPSKEPATPATVSPESSHFEKTFKPFVVKKDTTVAPVNWFAKRPIPLQYEGDVIVVDDDVETSDLAGMSAEERLRSTLQNLPSPVGPRRTRRTRSHLKTSNNVSVRELIKTLNEAEVSDEIPQILSQPKSLIFADDARPGYYGTWTRDSQLIGPRTPFVRDDKVFDYGYDSGEEWEEEPSGDADDLMDDGEEDDVDGEDADSDIESWLVEDDDEPVSPSAATGSPVPTVAKRKAEAEDTKLTKKRKVVVPLLPFAKGPSWEQRIGQCADEFSLFNAYRIQFLNDAPFPLDPFTFVSQTVTAGTKKDGFAVPALPDRLVAATAGTDVPPVVKKAAVAPKTSFPDEHLARLLDQITTSQTASLPILVDKIYQDLREHKVKKNAIEVKIREVAEKCKLKKVWVVKQGPV
ncbi:chromatin assembly factor 1 subunit A-domain-containing protein [Roridomyces roridus]|uniref:Chromatin assembly factor 1 subunit A-domain-containing protein n=1 Tax=Roridomyces roridus TaxID=1738132 RepID=A0AAD7BWI7_9AGAR|nr:chromatin assembly factor 1 subunit A-domain-containing protein [Roridomyces roridus]